MWEREGKFCLYLHPIFNFSSLLKIQLIIQPSAREKSHSSTLASSSSSYTPGFKIRKMFSHLSAALCRGEIVANWCRRYCEGWVWCLGFQSIFVCVRLQHRERMSERKNDTTKFPKFPPFAQCHQFHNGKFTGKMSIYSCKRLTGSDWKQVIDWWNGVDVKCLCNRCDNWCRRVVLFTTVSHHRDVSLQLSPEHGSPSKLCAIWIHPIEKIISGGSSFNCFVFFSGANGIGREEITCTKPSTL